MKLEVKDGMLVISLPVMNPPVESKTGKSLVIATTHGIVKTGVVVDGKEVSMGVNVFLKK